MPFFLLLASGALSPRRLRLAVLSQRKISDGCGSHRRFIRGNALSKGLVREGRRKTFIRIRDVRACVLPGFRMSGAPITVSRRVLDGIGVREGKVQFRRRQTKRARRVRDGTIHFPSRADFLNSWTRTCPQGGEP